MPKKSSRSLEPAEREEILTTLEARFEAHAQRHEGLAWADVRERLVVRADRLWSLHEMERSGGEPDVVGRDSETGEYLFIDCASQSPSGRRSLCYDGEALAARKKHKPTGSAVGMAEAMGVQLLDEPLYRKLQQVGEFDTKTSSWLRTPARIRDLGGAIFGDRRFDTIFVYHNGAESYYGGRGFRCWVSV